MKVGMLLRLSRLELRRKAEDLVVHRRVIRIPWGADPSEVPWPDLPATGSVQLVVLPQKAPSAQAWADKVRQNWSPQDTHWKTQ